MNIAIFTNNYLPNPYGVAGSIESFRKELEKEGHTVYIFAPHFKDYVDENPHVFRYPAVEFKFKNIRFPIAIPFSLKINKILQELEIDIIHAQHPNLLGWAAQRWAKKKNVPLMFTWHTLYDKYAHFTPLIPSPWAAWWAIGNAVRFANKADQIVVPTPSVKKIIQQWGVTNKNIQAIPTGVDTRLFEKPDRKGIREKYGIKENEILLVVITRLTQEKNIEFLFRSVAKVLKKKDNIKFLACGNGDLAEKLENYVQSVGLNSKVIFAGFVPNDIKRNYYAAGDIFVFASKSETQGMIISEAMYSGLPVVALDAPGVGDTVINQVTGLLTNDNEEFFANAVLRIAKDDVLRNRFSENAQHIAREHYTSAACAAKMLATYEAVIKRKETR